MKEFELLSFATADELASHAAGAWLDEIESAGRGGKSYCTALSGGRIARKFFAAAAEQAKTRKMGGGGPPFLPGNVHFFWADERCVPPNDPESNFKLANELLLAPLKIPGDRIHRIRGELPPDTAAAQAASELSRAAEPAAGGRPVLDLIILGMGEDGHVASLFPGAPPVIVNSAGPFLAVEDSPKPPPRRISLGYAAIGAARRVWVLISGAGKETALRESLKPDGRTPLARVIHSRPHTTIFTDFGAPNPTG